jgi:dihydroorotate dehydrogenase electron transfer subunit
MNAGPVQVTGEVLSVRGIGAYHQVTLVAPGVAERFRPGTLLSLAVGGVLSDRCARRTFPIQRARATGAYGATVELLVDADEPGERWLVEAPPGTRVDLVGPLGRPFALPKDPVPCVVIGYAAAAAPVQALAERLRERSCDVHVLLGAPSEPRLFGALDARRSARSVTVVTADGSVGIKGSVLDPLPTLLGRTSAGVVYAAGPAALLHDVAATAEQHGAWSQTAVDLPMPCGTGLCQSCVLPVVGADGVTRLVRACAEGPVFRGDRVRWADLGTVPDDAQGADRERSA